MFCVCEFVGILIYTMAYLITIYAFQGWYISGRFFVSNLSQPSLNSQKSFRNNIASFFFKYDSLLSSTMSNGSLRAFLTTSIISILSLLEFRDQMLENDTYMVPYFTFLSMPLPVEGLGDTTVLF